MCGLCGAAGVVYGKDEQAVKDLLWMNALRGYDSTGVATVQRHKDNVVKVAKVLGGPENLFGTKAFSKAMSGTLKVILGHNRSATRGSLSVENAHPFYFEDIVGIHNGTLYSSSHDKLIAGKSFPTDSEAIFNNLEIEGPEKTISKLEGAWALVWYNRADNTINMLRNDQRTLFYAFNDERNVLIWASEIEMLYSALNRNKISFDKSKVFLLSENMWHSWAVPSAHDRIFGPGDKKKLEGIKWTSGLWSGKKASTSPVTYVFDKDKGELVTKPDSNSVAKSVISKTNAPPISLRNFGVEKKYRERLKSEPDKDIFPLVWAGDGKKIHFNKTAKSWTIYTYDSSGYDWKSTTVKDEPDELKNVGPIEPGATERYRSKDMIIWSAKDAEGRLKWIVNRLMPSGGAWTRRESFQTPSEMPDVHIDIRSNHCFSHQGRRKHKKVYFKGWKGNLLSRERFNEIMMHQCINCGRVPVWENGDWGGIEVSFISPDQFLCAFCSEDTETVKDMIRLSKESKENGKS